eukprot:COSAG01_NODE_41924_length_445_cov_3.234104_1_plen_31_part_10
MTSSSMARRQLGSPPQSQQAALSGSRVLLLL